MGKYGMCLHEVLRETLKDCEQFRDKLRSDEEVIFLLRPNLASHGSEEACINWDNKMNSIYGVVIY